MKLLKSLLYYMAQKASSFAPRIKKHALSTTFGSEFETLSFSFLDISCNLYVCVLGKVTRTTYGAFVADVTAGFWVDDGVKI